MDDATSICVYRFRGNCRSIGTDKTGDCGHLFYPWKSEKSVVKNPLDLPLIYESFNRLQFNVPPQLKLRPEPASKQKRPPFGDLPFDLVSV